MIAARGRYRETEGSLGATRTLVQALKSGVLLAAAELPESSGLERVADVFQCLLERGLVRDAPRWDADPGRSRLAALACGGASVRLVERLAPAVRGALLSELDRAVEQTRGGVAVDLVGALIEPLLPFAGRARSVSPSRAHKSRKPSGSYYTPPALAEAVVEELFAPRLTSIDALAPEGRVSALLALGVCDPAMGAGAFLLPVVRKLAERLARARGALPVSSGPPVSLSSMSLAARAPSLDPQASHGPACALEEVLASSVQGIDTSPLAVAVAEAALWFLVGRAEIAPRALGRGLRVGDALLDSGLRRSGGRGFDFVVGNPPWVAYAGRSTQPLTPARRARLSRRFEAWRGFPTLHGLFVERAAELAPQGSVGLLVPSPLADLDGYRYVRRAVTKRHRVREPLMEFGQDAFEGVTQPCFAFIADAAIDAAASEAPWCLVERQRRGAIACSVAIPDALSRLSEAPTLPAQLFGEMGFQSSRVASRQLLRRSAAPEAPFDYPLLEGRDVREFYQGPARLFLRADPGLLKAAGCRARPVDAYRAVAFVVRQTATLPIAALHRGDPFRNSLLAGFEQPGWPKELLVALLNSALYRALHVARQRDARQAAFPQVKLSHLRGLPRPRKDATLFERLTRLADDASRGGVSVELRRTLDDAVFELFELGGDQRQSVRRFLAERAPRQGYGEP